MVVALDVEENNTSYKKTLTIKQFIDINNTLNIKLTLINLLRNDLSFTDDGVCINRLRKGDVGNQPLFS